MTAQTTIDVGPIESNGEHYVSVTMDGHEMNRHGPYPNADEAEAVANRLLRFSRALTSSSGGNNRG
jgi:hypothetical protein